jgi:hypothetical protein
LHYCIHELQTCATKGNKHITHYLCSSNSARTCVVPITTEEIALRSHLELVKAPEIAATIPLVTSWVVKLLWAPKTEPARKKENVCTAISLLRFQRCTCCVEDWDDKFKYVKCFHLNWKGFKHYSLPSSDHRMSVYNNRT